MRERGRKQEERRENRREKKKKERKGEGSRLSHFLAQLRHLGWGVRGFRGVQAGESRDPVKGILFPTFSRGEL